MTLSGGQVSLGVNPDTRGFGAKLADGIMGESGGFGGIGGKIAGLIAGGIAAVGIGEGLKKVFETGFDEAKDAAAGTAQLTAGIESTGNAANVSVEGLNNLASSIQDYSGQTDDSIVKSEQLLLTFTNIKNNGPDKIFDMATQASADMAAKMGGDASQSAILLGKALNDPVKGISALQRVGVSFTDSQKKAIDAMVQTGDTAGAQKIILKELGTEFGGAAKAAGESFPGELQRAKRAFEDLSQGIVQGFLPVFGPVLEGAIELMHKITPAISEAGQAVATKGAAIGAALSGVYDLLVKGDFTSKFREAFHVEEDSPIVDILLKVHDGFGAALAAAQIFVGGVKTGVSAAGDGILGTFAHVGNIIHGAFWDAREAAGLFFGALKTGTAGEGSSAMVALAGTIGASLHSIFAQVGPLIPQILSLASAFSPLHLIFTAIAPVLPQILSLVTSLAVALAGSLGSALVQLLPPLTQLAGTLARDLSGAVISLLPTITQLATITAGVLTQALQFIVPILVNVATWLTENAHLVIGAVAAFMAFKGVTEVMNIAKLAQEGFAAASYGTAGASYASSAAAKAGAIAYGLMNSTLVTGVTGWWANTAAQLANSEGGLLAKAGILATAAASGIATAAQWLWNAAMDANPIGLLIVGIGALVAGIIWVATQTTFFQDAWKVCVDAIGAAWNWLWNTVISPVIQFFVSGFNILAKAVQDYWNGWLHPVIMNIAGIFTWLWNSILWPIVELWLLAFTLIGLGAKWLWDNAIQPVVNFIVAGFQFLGSVVAWLWTNAIQPAINAVGDVFTWLWNTIIMPIVDFIVGYFQMLGAIASWLWSNAIQPAIQAIGDVFNWLWNSVISPIGQWIGDAIHTVGDVIGKVFGAVGDTIRGAFDGVVGFIKGVINSVIDVINGGIGSINGLIDAVNSIPGAPHFDHFGAIPHLATGGTIRTPGTALVGENGPELVTLPAGATVYPHGTGPGGTVNNFSITGATNTTAVAQTVMQYLTARKV